MTVDITFDIKHIRQSAPFYFALYMSLLGGNWIVYHVSLPVRIAHHIILSAFLMYWLFKHGLPDTPLLLCVGLMLVALVMSGLGAIDRRMALEFVWHWITNWLVLLYLIDTLRRDSAGYLFKAVFAAGLLLALSCIVQWAIWGGRTAGLFGVINLSGAYLAALIVPALGWILASRNRRHRQYLAMCIGLMAGAIVINNSRGPVLSVMVALTAFGFLIIKRHTILKLAAASILILLCVAIVAGLSLQSGHKNGDTIRFDLWDAGGDMLMEYPTGVGVGLFAQAYHQRTVSEDRFTGAHNYYINLGAEFGAPGLAAGAAFLLIALYFLIDRERSIQQNAVLASLLGVLAHMIGDNYPAQNWTFLLSLYAAYLLYEVKIINRPIPQFVNHMVLYVLLVYGVLFAKWDMAQIHYEKALQLHSIEEARAALAMDEHNDLYALEVKRLESADVVINPNFAITNYARISY